MALLIGYFFTIIFFFFSYFSTVSIDVDSYILHTPHARPTVIDVAGLRRTNYKVRTFEMAIMLITVIFYENLLPNRPVSGPDFNAITPQRDI